MSSPALPAVMDLETVLAERGVPRDGGVPPVWGMAKGTPRKLFLADPDASVVGTDEQLLSHSWLISTPAVDRVGDVMEPQGCLKHLASYAKSAPVFLNHQTENSLPIGKSTHPETGELVLTVQPDGIRATCFFHGKTVESAQVYELVKLGYLKGASIGFRPIKAQLMPAPERPKGEGKVGFEYRGLRFEEWELLEWSVVGIPCNPEALDGLKSVLSKGLAGDPVNAALRASLAAMIPEIKSVTVSVPADPPAETDSSAAATPPAVEKTAGPPVGDALPPKEEEVVPAWKSELEAVVALLTEGQAALAEQVKLLAARPKDYEEPAAAPAATAVTVTVPEPEPEEEKVPSPLGVQVLKKLCRELDELYHYCECKLPVLEQSKVKAFVSEFHADLDVLMAKVKKFANRVYPDWFPKDSKETPVPAAKALSPDLLAALAANKAALTRIDDAFYSMTGKKVFS